MSPQIIHHLKNTAFQELPVRHAAEIKPPEYRIPAAGIEPDCFDGFAGPAAEVLDSVIVKFLCIDG